MLKKIIKITILIDSATLFNFLILNENNKNKILIIGIKAAIEAYNDCIIDNIICIRTKFKFSFQAVDEVKVHFEVEQSVKLSL